MSSVESRSTALLSPKRKRNTSREFLPAALEILETPASPAGRMIGATISLFFAIAIVWSTIGHVDIIATAQGKIVPSGRTKTIQPLEAGMVSAIHVQDGDKVSSGQVLVELDRTVTQAERTRAAQDLTLSELDVSRLGALRDHFGSLSQSFDLIPPKGATEMEVARARLTMQAQAAEQLAKLASLNRQIDQKLAEAQSASAAIAKIDASLPLVEETAEVRRKAMEIQYGNRIAYLDAQTRFVDQRSERLVQQRKLSEIEAGRKALVEQVDQTRSGFERQVMSDLADAHKKADEFSQDLVKAERKVDEQVLRSPIDGTVQQLALHTIGGVVTPAQQLMQIVPVDSRIEAEAMISNRDIGFVDVGQNADIKIDTFNFTRYGLLQGRVVSVSQDAIVRDKASAKAGAPKADGALSDSSEPEGQELLYAARVSLTETHMAIDGKLVNLAPGMAVTVEIKTGTRRIIEYLMAPLIRYKQESLRER